jgi:hypothetical protein
MNTTTDQDDEETVPQSSHRVWVEDWELRQQEIERLAVEMFLESKLEQSDH